MRLALFTLAAWAIVSPILAILAGKWLAAGNRRRVRWPDGTTTSGSDGDDLPGMPRHRRDASDGSLHPMPRRGGAL